MTAQRTRDDVERLVVTDRSGDQFVVTRLPPTVGAFVAVLGTPDDALACVLDLDDTLAVLSFLADCAGVERYVPGGAG